MAIYRPVRCSLWESEPFYRLDAVAKAFYLYVQTCPGQTASGMFECNASRVLVTTGLWNTARRAKFAKEKPAATDTDFLLWFVETYMCDTVSYLDGWLYLRPFYKEQSGTQGWALAALKSVRLAPDPLVRDFLYDNGEWLAARLGGEGVATLLRMDMNPAVKQWASSLPLASPSSEFLNQTKPNIT